MKLLDFIGRILDKIFGFFARSKHISVELEEQETTDDICHMTTETTDDICHMTLEESYKIKQKMEDDINIAKDTIRKAEALKEGRLFGDYRPIFYSDTPSDFLHIKNKVDMDRVKRYCISNGINIKKLVKYWEDIEKYGDPRQKYDWSAPNYSPAHEEEVFDETIAQMEKMGNIINWLNKKEEE